MLLKLSRKKYDISKFIHLLIITINIFVLFFAQMLNSYVFADDDIEVVVVSDPGTMAAFRYFNNYGWESNFSNTTTQIYTTSGTTTLTGNFTFTGSFTGSFDATIELAVDTLIGTELADVDDILTGYTHYYLDKDEVKLIIHPTDNATQQNNGFSFGCVYNAQSTSTSSTMTCTPTSGLAETIILPDQEITIDSIDTLFNSVTNYSITLTLRNEGTIVGNIEGTLSGSIGGSGNVNLSGVYTETTTTSNNTKYEFTMPYMTYPTDRWYRQESYNQDFAFLPDKNDTYVIAWISNINLVSFLKLYKNNNDFVEIPSDKYTLNWKYIFGSSNDYQLDYIETNYYQWMHMDIGNRPPYVKDEKIYPLYVGYKSQMSDELYRFIYGSDRLIEFLEHGNTQSQSAANGMNQVEQDFVGKTDELIDFEGDTFNSMDSAIDGVQLDNNLISGSGFLNAANWVRVQFDNLISYSPLSSILVFSLSLGFALLIIGKVR